ncbi:MAG: signal peptidase I [Myxococcales bacterium]|nr:signal peptidase I [Myxococcales bacterium]MCB9643245.1 signal peptidase I [Myxococcales bacterium]
MSNAIAMERRRAHGLLIEVKRLQKKHTKKIEPADLEKLDSDIKLLEAELERKEPEADKLSKALKALEMSAARILGPYRKSVFREYSDSILIAVTIAILLRAFLIEPFKIPSGSMIPTLEIGDHIFVNKMSYGLWMPLINKKLRIGGGPQRGDVVVFIYPAEKRTSFLIDNRKDFIKRVVGLPGDRIAVRGGVLYINGKAISRAKKEMHSYHEPVDDARWEKKQGRIYQEDLFGVKYTTLADEQEHSIFQNWSSKDNGPLSRRPWGPVVKPGHIFVMGDNRDHSSDSRDWGLVPVEMIKGRAFSIWFSMRPEKGGYFWERIRWERIFKGIR